MAKSNGFKILLSPWAVIAGMISGVIIGLQYKGLVVYLAPLGEVYLALLQMCIIPIMITAVLSSLGSIFMSGEATVYLKRLVVVFIIGLMIASAVGLSVGIITRPGVELNKKAQIVLGKKVSEIEGASEEQSESKKNALLEFIKEIVTENVIGAISKGKNLPVLFFFILLGISIGLAHSQSGKNTLEMINVFYDAILRIISWIMYGLPFGLCFLLASQVAQVGPDIMFALLKFIITCYIAALIMIGFYGMAIAIKTGGSFFHSFSALKETFVVALGTSSSFATIPAALRELQDKLHLDKRSTNLVVPLGINLNPHGSVMYFAISAVFISQLYGVSLNGSSLAIILIGSILAGLAATGAPGIGALSMIALVLEPLGLPVATAVILLAAIDPIIDPIITLTTVHANCAAATLVAQKN